MDKDAPYAGLTPDRVLDAVESVGLPCDGRLLTLNSFENRVYQLGLEEGRQVVAKFYRPGRWSDDAILEEHAFSLELAAREIPVVAPQAIAGRTLHEHGGFVPPELEETWLGVVDQALEGVERAFERAGDVAILRLHGDCHQGNVLWTADGPHFVDFDDSRMGPAVQDLWMLLSGDEAERGRQLGKILRGYEQFAEFDDRELYLVEALRTLRLIHYSAWIARRWDDPAFPAAFPWFDTPRYWQDRILELREQIPLMDESPIRPA
ncbi:Stress response kinase A [Rhodocyclaceae bacterium]|nr:Stress response kinase A [Rhodocyclaceae bacterium]